MRKILSTPNVLMGAPRIDGTRISIYNIVSSLWHERDLREFENDFAIKENEIKNALFYCRDLQCKKDRVLKFCSGCVLDFSKEDMKKSFYKQNDNLFVDTTQNFYIAENTKDIENELVGFKGWCRAEKLCNEFYFDDSSACASKDLK